MLPTTTRTPLTTLRFFTLAIAAVVTLAVTGCAANFGDMKSSGPLDGSPDPGTALQGKAFGGNLPIVGGTVQLYAVGTTGYGSAATPLITSTTVTTLAGGLFTITGDYSCPSNSYVYLTISGGNPGLSANNPAIALMTALGPCSGLGSIGFINVNEFTTVAAVWALQQFASTTNGTALSTTPYPTAASDTFGVSSTNAQGVANAMNLSNVLVNLQTGVTPSADTSGNQLNVEYWQINTIADILADCVNSDGGGTSPCNTLFTNTGGAADTIQAALYMAKNPTSNITNLFNLVTGTPSFTPADSSAPNDFTIGLSYQTGTLATRWIAIDGYGNAWVTAGTAVYELDPTGNKITTPTSYTVASTSTSIGTAYEVAVDTSNNAWFTDETKFNIFEVKASGSAGGANGGAGTAVASGASSNLEAIVVDGNNNVWATASSAHMYELPSGSTTVTTGGTTTSNPFGMAVDLSNQSSSPNHTVSGGGSFVYALNSGGCTGISGLEMGGTASQTGGSIDMEFAAGTNVATATGMQYIVDASCANVTNMPNNTPSSGVPYAGTTPYVFMSLPYGLAVDHSNNLWIVNQNYVSTTDKTSTQFSLTKMTANYSAGLTPASSLGTMTYVNYEGGGLNTPYYLAMDGASAAWVANSSGGAISAFTNTGTAISPSTGLFGGTYVNGSVTYKRTYGSPRGIAVDGSGNVWVANTSTATMPGGSSAVGFVTVTVGAATPTVTPLATGIANGTLASKP